jgi:hypothetical protein
VPNWQPVEMFDGPSLWGHDRVWLGPEDRKGASDMRMKAAREGKRAPVQVMQGKPKEVFTQVVNSALPAGSISVDDVVKQMNAAK